MNLVLFLTFMVDLKMKSSHVTFIYLTIIGLLGWNVFLAQRDQQLYDSFDKIKQEQVNNNLSSHKRVCEQLKVWHPDCKIE